MANRKKGKKQVIRPRFVTKVVVIVLLLSIGWRLYGLREQLRIAQAEKERYAAEVETLQRQNDALAADIAEGPTLEKIEEIAREKLGLVKPGEYVFEPGN